MDELGWAVESLAAAHAAFRREALHLALRRHQTAQLEQQHAAGYAQHPVQPGEFDVWNAEPDWEE
jgi:hypothetical protein